MTCPRLTVLGWEPKIPLRAGIEQTYSWFLVKRICPGGSLVTIEEYYQDLEYFRGATNYLAVHRSPAKPS